MAFRLNRSDLDFLLAQVTIGIDYSQLVNALDPGGLREVSGSNNNLVGSSVGTPGPFVEGPYTTVGQADQNFLRLSQTSYNPSGADAAYATLGNGSAGNVTDATPRLVSNLVATSFTSGPDANPAAIEAVTDFYGVAPDDPAFPGNPDVAVLPNAGVLGGGRYNAWFVAFGQFFDHGLDFVQKGASGTITIDIKPGDPLYVDPFLPNDTTPNPEYIPGVSNIMRVSRANLANPATDFNPDGTLIAGTTPIYKNNTGLLIDQSQTYGSHESMNAFLREYSGAGAPTGRIMTGNTHLLDDGIPSNDGDAKGLATWADIKLNALRIGVVLTDQDVFNAPMLRVDATGKLLFTPGATDWATSSIVIGAQTADDPFMRDAMTGAVLRTNQAFLIDINPAADPSNHHDVDANGVEIVYAGGLDYDAALLDAHYVTGDGRANENYLLTAVHHVFHEEHNFQVNNVKTAIQTEAAAILAAEGQAAADAFIAQWQTSPDVWDGEKLFQAARLITESEYNHIAIDQYVGTLYGALAEFVSYSSDINMGVSLEFSQAIFRLGHSMLTNTFQVIDPVTQAVTDVPLLDAFLNPTAFAGNEAAITLGLTRTYGNEVDEFVTPALQQSLLGQPLDLATINIARGRDVGLPTHNELRQQIYDGLLQYSTNNTNNFALAPYTSWQDYGDHLKHPGTLVNMIAAYARDTGGVMDWGIDEARAAYLAGTGTLDDIRIAAQAVIDAYTNGADPNHAAAVTFMQGTPTFNSGTGQWEFTGGDQGFWDVDLWIGGLAERPLFDGPLGTTFSYILLDFAQRQQDGDRFYYLYRTPMGTHLGNEIIENQFGQLVARATGLEHLNGEVFITPDGVFELGKNPDGTDAGTNDFFDAAIATITYPDLTTGPASGGHLIIAGNGGNDYMMGGLGDDTIYGDAGNDSLFGSQGNDHLFGGAGDDYIFDDENDDFITGGAGNDRIFAGPGAIDTVFGDEGDDEIHGGDGVDELLGGEGDDLIYGDGDTDVLFGENGNDYLEGGDSVDEMWGADGNDWIRGGVGDDHLNGGAGNDLLEGGLGPAANDGDRLTGAGVTDSPFPFGPNPDDVGVDIASYEDVAIAIVADLDTSNQNGTGGLIDTYAGIDGLVGSRFNDDLTGAGPGTTSSNGFDNLLVGGDGNDILTGLGGDDFIAGDSVVVRNDLSVYLGLAGGYTTIANWKGTGEARPDFGALGGLGHFLGDNGSQNTTADTAVFSGQRGDYAVTLNLDGTLRIVDNRGIDSTAVGDTVKDVELFQFSDGAGGTVTLTQAQLLNAASTDIQWNAVRPSDTALPAAGAIIANLSTVDPDSTAFTYSLRPGSSAGFTVSAAGVVTRTGSAMAQNTTYTLIVRSTDNDSGGLFRDETFTIRTNGTGNSTNLGTFATAGDDVLYGIAGNDTNVDGSGGNDTLFGQAGTDALNGGDGNDELTGGTGNDAANGGAGNDTFNYTIGDGADAVDGGADFDTLNILGTGGGNTLNVTFNGAVITNFESGTVTGVDSIMADLLAGTDTLTYAGTLAANSVTVNLTAGMASGFTSIANIENVTGGSGNDTLIGNGDANVLNGGANGGADTLIGGGGVDTLIGGAGNDMFIAEIGDGNDSYTGGADTDTYDLSATMAAAAVNLGTGNASSAEIGIDTLATIENVIGGQGDDTISGSAGINTLDGGAGADIINAGNGADILIGGTGNDIMNGGAGNDRFVCTAGFGNDTISGFDADPTGGQDLLDISALGINAGDFGSSVTIADMGGDTLVTIDANTITLLNVNWTTVYQQDFVLA